MLSAAKSGIDFNLTKGGQIRDFISVDQVAKSFVDVAINGEMREGHPLVANIGSGYPVSVRTFLRNGGRNLTPRAISFSVLFLIEKMRS